MNDQGSKKILFNKSTLFSLKAELLRKQEEVNEKKQLSKHKIENFKPPPAKVQDNEKNSNKEYKKSFKDSLKAVDTEELEACRKSKLALEKKAELYEHLADQAGSSELAGRFLVDFNTKKKQEVPKEEEEILPIKDIVIDNEATDIKNDDEWTEFTDCLGRSRKCHKSDIDMFMKRDSQLMRVINKSTTSDVDKPEETSEPAKEKPLLVQKTNDYLQSLRDKWEQKEQELLAKDKDIHYQDILFDEARIHGVGYYSFSTDETERRKQMDDLIKRRDETLKAQQQAEEVRKKRDEMMAARVAAARARQRARAGLPPEEPKENEKDFTTCLMEFLTQQKNEADAKANEEERKLKEKQEAERQKLREAYVREWDIGKDGVEGTVKKFREMSQEEYVELQRSKRIKEFAPPQTSTSDNDNIFDLQGRMTNPDRNLIRNNKNRKDRDEDIDSNEVPTETVQKTWADVRPRVETPPPPDIGDLTEISQKGLYFTSNKKGKNVKYKNFVNAQETTPIVNELDTDTTELERSDDIRNEGSATEMAPPPTYDYYGPEPKKKKFEKPFVSDIREAYAQGAKSLESKSSNRKLPQHYDFTFD